LNVDKTNFIQFTNKSICTSDIQIKHEDKQINVVNETKFLGLFINNNLSWKTHVESEIYHTDTRQHANFHQPSVNVTKYQNGVYYLGVKVFNILPSYIKTEFDNPKKFKAVLQNFYMEIAFILWMKILNF
jgi:hypothetical protein